jgi:hypothetical protein
LIVWKLDKEPISKYYPIYLPKIKLCSFLVCLSDLGDYMAIFPRIPKSRYDEEVNRYEPGNRRSQKVECNTC